MDRKIRRGEIYIADLDPVIGSEQGGERPVLVIQNNVGNTHSPMMLQKTYIENCINKKVKKNRGEMAKYLITNNHPAIISKETFKLVQAEIARRSSKRKTSDLSITEQGKYSGKFALTEILVCGECGSPYRRKTWVQGIISRKSIR